MQIKILGLCWNDTQPECKVQCIIPGLHVTLFDSACASTIGIGVCRLKSPAWQWLTLYMRQPELHQVSIYSFHEECRIIQGRVNTIIIQQCELMSRPGSLVFCSLKELSSIVTALTTILGLYKARTTRWYLPPEKCLILGNTARFPSVPSNHDTCQHSHIIADTITYNWK